MYADGMLDGEHVLGAESQESQSEGEETITDWDQRRAAVSDDNYKKEEDAYQQQMQAFNEREKIIEREHKLLEMKEKMLEREKQLKQKEKELAARHAAYNRYESREVSFGHSKHVADWLNSQELNLEVKGDMSVAREDNNRQNQGTMTRAFPHDYTQHDCYNSAMQLANDDNLTVCRQTGTTRLNTMGLARSQVLGATQSQPPEETREQLRNKHAMAGAIPKKTGNLVIGKLDDGESLASFVTHASMVVNRTDGEEGTEKKKLKSGMYDKVADDVVIKLKWPRKKLSRRWVPEKLSINQLQFEHVVAGELAIIQRSDNPDEIRFRTHMLQKVAYWNMQGQGWPRVRNLYFAMLHAIEEGDATFQSTFNEFNAVFPVKNVSKTNTGRRETYWCRDFNKGDCSLESGHKAIISGQERSVQHICATCWRMGKKEKHKESDSMCPQKEL